MSTKTISTFRDISTLEDLHTALAHVQLDADYSRCLLGEGLSVHPCEIHFAPISIDLVRETLTDGSHVFNLRIRLAVA